MLILNACWQACAVLLCPTFAKGIQGTNAFRPFKQQLLQFFTSKGFFRATQRCLIYLGLAIAGGKAGVVKYSRRICDKRLQKRLPS